MKELNEAVAEYKRANKMRFKGYKWHLCWIDNSFQLMTDNDLWLAPFFGNNYDVLI